MPTPPIEIAVVFTVHNRRSMTSAMLRSLKTATRSGIVLHIFATDDGSTDGTMGAILREAPDATVIPGDGNLYWAGGMRLALRSAERQGANLYLLVNDDVVFDPDFLERIVDLWAVQDDPTTIVVGSLRGSDGATSYGGFRRTKGLGVRLTRQEPAVDRPLPVDTFNANCVLIPAKTLADLGGIESAYVHGLGDIDLGLRARSANIPILLAPGHVGTCPDNPVRSLDRRPGESVSRFIRRIFSPKALPASAWLRYNRRHAGLLWPLTYVGAYANLIRRAIFGKART